MKGVILLISVSVIEVMLAIGAGVGAGLLMARLYSHYLKGELSSTEALLPPMRVARVSCVRPRITLLRAHTECNKMQHFVSRGFRLVFDGCAGPVRLFAQFSEPKMLSSLSLVSCTVKACLMIAVAVSISRSSNEASVSKLFIPTPTRSIGAPMRTSASKGTIS